MEGFKEDEKGKRRAGGRFHRRRKRKEKGHQFLFCQSALSQFELIFGHPCFYVVCA